jgi:hypothetical protein
METMTEREIQVDGLQTEYARGGKSQRNRGDDPETREGNPRRGERKNSLDSLPINPGQGGEIGSATFLAVPKEATS